MNLMEKFDPSSFDLTLENFRYLDERTLTVTKWSWDYKLAHAFQKKMVELLQDYPRERILIACNHPRVLTNGRGLQKPRKGETLELVEFDPKAHPNLPYPLHQIERGGGLTFHHPGQFIFYPILKLNPQSLSLSKMTDEIFDFAIEILSDWGIKGLHHSSKMLGLWYGEKKMASMGIAIEKLTTYHGMALNLFQDEEMKKALKILNPCGLSADIYVAADELITLPPDALNVFSDEFFKRISHGWQ